MRLPLRSVGFCFCLSEVIIIDIIFCISVPRLCSIRYSTPLEYAVASGLMLEPLARMGVERSDEERGGGLANDLPAVSASD